ncbi:acyltransferase family protein [Microbulbifer sp. Q7]|uniref:acyltransferase family protein n=1 Tax=Microbulbifer sp. Q7 TaxID=1785091 RepID=UPI00082BE56A|nr:acyltransferase family protein [Microbulbifer sp. Q7]
MRDVVLDNFKFILISLVIVGHVIEPVIGRFDWAKSVYIFIYIFHMPMFAYVSGVVSSREINNAVVKNIVSKLIIPYVLLELTYSMFDYFLFSRNSLNVTPLVPYWILWYLFSLVLWRLLLPIFNQFRFPVVLAILAGLACGVNEYNYNLSFSRTFVFFPFFLIGNYYHSTIIRTLRSYDKSKLIGSVVLLGIFLLILAVPESNDIKLGWLYGSRSYSSLGVDWVMGFFYRSSIYAAAILLGIALLSVTKNNRSIGTKYGEDSLYIYVLHGFVMKGLIAVGFYKYFDEDYEIVILMAASLVLLPILSSRFSKIIGKHMMNPLGGLSNGGFANLVLANKTMQSDARSSRR